MRDIAHLFFELAVPAAVVPVVVCCKESRDGHVVFLSGGKDLGLKETVGYQGKIWTQHKKSRKRTPVIASMPCRNGDTAATTGDDKGSTRLGDEAQSKLHVTSTHYEQEVG